MIEIDLKTARLRTLWPKLLAEIVPAAIGLAVVLALSLSCLAWRSDFYFHDDFATFFLPIMRETARLAGEGHFPLVTDRLWHGGALVAEYQHGVLNPFTFGMAVIVGHIDNLSLAAAIFAIAHLAVFGLGAYTLLRLLRAAPALAALGAVVAPTSEWVFYWGATNWIPALTSMAWIPWAAAAVIQSTKRTTWIPAAALGVAMVMTAGWPFANLALVIVCATGGMIGITYGRAAWPAVARAAAACLLGAMLAAPAILPTLPYTALSGRPTVDPLFRGSLEALVGVSTPFMVETWQAFGPRPQIILFPMLAVSWFVLPALTAGDWRHLWARPAVRILAGSALTLALGSLLPSFWQFRWMFRLLPYYQLAILLLAIIALGRAKWRPLPAFLAAAVPVWIASVGVPPLAWLYVAMGLFIVVLLGLILRLPHRQLSILLAGHVAFFVVVSGFYSLLPHRYPNDWRPPARVERLAEPTATRYAMFDLPSGPGNNEAYWKNYRAGNISLDHPGTAINGYSPFFLKPYQKIFCVQHLGATSCRDVVERVSAPILSGRSALDLARVDEVMAQSRWSERFERLHPDWVRSELQDGGARFTRSSPLEWPAPIGFAPADAQIRVLANAPSRIRMDVSSATGGEMVLARAWYPGWTAALDNRPLRVSALRGVFTTIVLPPGSRGTVTITYWPAGMTHGFWFASFAAASMLLILGWQVFARRTGFDSRPIKAAAA